MPPVTMPVGTQQWADRHCVSSTAHLQPLPHKLAVSLHKSHQASKAWFPHTCARHARTSPHAHPSGCARTGTRACTPSPPPSPTPTHPPTHPQLHPQPGYKLPCWLAIHTCSHPPRSLHRLQPPWAPARRQSVSRWRPVWMEGGGQGAEANGGKSTAALAQPMGLPHPTASPINMRSWCTSTSPMPPPSCMGGGRGRELKPVGKINSCTCAANGASPPNGLPDQHAQLVLEHIPHPATGLHGRGRGQGGQKPCWSTHLAWLQPPQPGKAGVLRHLSRLLLCLQLLRRCGPVSPTVQPAWWGSTRCPTSPCSPTGPRPPTSPCSPTSTQTPLVRRRSTGLAGRACQAMGRAAPARCPQPSAHPSGTCCSTTGRW